MRVRCTCDHIHVCPNWMGTADSLLDQRPSKLTLAAQPHLGDWPDDATCIALARGVLDALEIQTRIETQAEEEDVTRAIREVLSRPASNDALRQEVAGLRAATVAELIWLSDWLEVEMAKPRMRDGSPAIELRIATKIRERIEEARAALKDGGK